LISEIETRTRDPFFDPLADAVIADPYPFYRRLREHDPVYRHEQLDSWVCTGYEQCRQVLGDAAAFGSDFRRAGEDVPAAHLSVQSLDSPEHTAIRRLLVAALHHRSPAALHQPITDLVTDRLAALPRNGEVVDLISGFARPVAHGAIGRFLSIRLPSGPAFEELSNAIVHSMDAGLEPDRATPGTMARGELSRMIEEWLTDDPGRGFLGAVARVRNDFPEVTTPVLANSMRAVLHAAYEPVSCLVGNVLGRLAATSPDPSWRALPAGLTDELKRLDGPVQADARVCADNTRLGRHHIRRGQVVILMLAAANRDPAFFPAPDAVDVTRPSPVHEAV
jgi:cytochrome P450